MIKHLNMDSDGLEMFLGRTEAEVMRAVWSFNGPVTIRDIWEKVLQNRKVAQSTVATTMERLVSKNLLSRQERLRGDRAILFEPRYVTEQAFIDRCLAVVRNKVNE